ncbi:MAG TPA: hypothetical protein VMN58_09555 [Acidimicrobiales bacterium]|nr:hypothetical protein [Acidimicrobiales bacterium]
MSERDLAELFEGIDRPRPLPPLLRADLEIGLTGVAPVLVGAEAARPVPEDLRQRLEASLLPAPPMPRRLHRRVTASLAGPPPALVRLTAAAAAIVVLAGLLVTAGRDATDDRVATSPTAPVEPRAGVDREGLPGPDGAGPAPGAPEPPPFVALPPPGAPEGGASPSAGGQAGGQADAGGGGGSGGDVSAGPTAGGADELLVVLDGDGSVAAEGFRAYLRLLNEAGGVGGRPVLTVGTDGPTSGAVASVNLGAAAVAADGGAMPPWVEGVLFETLHVTDAPLRGAVTSLASPLEAQARLAVARAYPSSGVGERAAVYVDAASPWGEVAGAFERALRDRGVTPLRVPFDRGAPTLVAADAAFLALPPDAVAAWLAVASGRPPPRSGTWGVGSAWIDASVDDAAAAALQVLSPYAPARGEELDALRDALGHPLSAEAVHGWVTAKAIAFLLFDNGGAVLDEASLDRLVGWSSSWSPPFEVRPGTRARTPEAVPLRPEQGAFRADGPFERAPS